MKRSGRCPRLPPWNRSARKSQSSPRSAKARRRGCRTGHPARGSPAEAGIMDFQIVWTEPALGDLQKIVAYIACDDAVAAARVGNDIVDHVEILRTFSFIGPAYPRGFAWQPPRNRLRQLPHLLPGFRAGAAGGSSDDLARRAGYAEIRLSQPKFPFDSRHASSILPSLFRTASGEKSRSIGVKFHPVDAGTFSLFCPVEDGSQRKAGEPTRREAHIAQLAEHVLGKDEVTGSIPVMGLP